MKKLTLSLIPSILITFILLILVFVFTFMIILMNQAKADSFSTANVEFNPLALDEDRCPGVMIFPGTRSGSYNAYYYLVKPYPKMNIDFEDIAYVPSFKKEGTHRSFYYAIYFPSYNETNPFDEYADIPCGKEQLKREITKVLPSQDRPENPLDINLSRLKINTLSFSIPSYYKNLGYELIYDEALNDPQNAGVIYSRGTFIVELRIPESEFGNLIEILRSDIGFPLSIKMGFKAKEQSDYKEVSVDIGSMMSELKATLGGESQTYFTKAEISSAIKASRSFADIEIYGESDNIDQWISSVLIPMLSSYAASKNSSKPMVAPSSSPSSSSGNYSPYNPYPKPPAPKPTPGTNGGEKIYLNLSGSFESDFKKFTYLSDVLNPNAAQEYLVYQYPLRYYGEIDGNYFVLESNRYEETERYSQIYLNEGDSLEFTVEGYWEVTPKLIRKQYYFTEYHLNSGELPYIFTKSEPQFKIEDVTGELYIYGVNMLIPGSTIGGRTTSSYTKIGRVEITPVSFGNGYFPKYFNWTPIFPANSNGEDAVKYKSLKGTNLFDVKVPLNNLRPYSIEDLLKMIPLGVRFWKGKSIAVGDILGDTNPKLREEVAQGYFRIDFDNIRQTVILTAKRSGHLYFENLDFVEPKLEIRPADINDPNAKDRGPGWKTVEKEDFIKMDEHLFSEIAKKDLEKIDKNAQKRSKRSTYKESEKPLQYDFIHHYPSGIMQSFNRASTIRSEIYFPLENPTVEVRTYIKLKLFDM